MKRIGMNHYGYPEIRNFAGLPISDYTFVQSYDLFRVMDHIHFRMKHNTNQELHNKHLQFPGRVNGYHFFNSVSYGKKPWLSTFETTLPRWFDIGSKNHRRGIELITKDSCRGIIAISQVTADHMASMVSDHYPEMYDSVISKMSIIHPAQRLYVDRRTRKPDNIIRFVFVGRMFFLKGGYLCCGY